MVYKVVNIINTNVVLGTNTPFFQNFKLAIIVFECNGFMQCRLILYTSIGCIFLIMKQFLFKIQVVLNQYILQLHVFE
jgi:hypothetical protein